MRELAAQRANPYGDGHAAEQIAAVLAEQVPALPSLQKRFFDLGTDALGAAPSDAGLSAPPDWEA